MILTVPPLFARGQACAFASSYSKRLLVLPIAGTKGNLPGRRRGEENENSGPVVHAAFAHTIAYGKSTIWPDWHSRRKRWDVGVPHSVLRLTRLHPA